jgi:hypothetical protein
MLAGCDGGAWHSGMMISLDSNLDMQAMVDDVISNYSRPPSRKLSASSTVRPRGRPRKEITEECSQISGD